MLPCRSGGLGSCRCSAGRLLSFSVRAGALSFSVCCSCRACGPCVPLAVRFSGAVRRFTSSPSRCAAAPPASPSLSPLSFSPSPFSLLSPPLSSFLLSLPLPSSLLLPSRLLARSCSPPLFWALLSLSRLGFSSCRHRAPLSSGRPVALAPSSSLFSPSSPSPFPSPFLFSFSSLLPSPFSFPFLLLSLSPSLFSSLRPPFLRLLPSFPSGARPVLSSLPPLSLSSPPSSLSLSSLLFFLLFFLFFFSSSLPPPLLSPSLSLLPLSFFLPATSTARGQSIDRQPYWLFALTRRWIIPHIMKPTASIARQPRTTMSPCSRRR